MARYSKFDQRMPLSKRQIYTEDDLYPEDDDRQIEIWIRVAGWMQLDNPNGDKLFEPLTCSRNPTPQYCVQTLVPLDSVEDDVFYPDRTEPDLISERCSAYAVPSAEPVANMRVKRLQSLKPGDEVILKQVGYGLVSYERSGPVVEIRDGRLYTETFDEIGLEWEGNNWVFDTGLGLRSIFVFRNEVPEGEEIAGDEAYQ